VAYSENARSVILRKIRVKKEDSAFVYFILESYEGICGYSTLEGPPEANFRELELQIPACFDQEVQEVLNELGDLVL
jgi:hypothetical protein